MNQIEKLRLKAKISQNDLASALNVTQSAISQWESGLSMPRAELLPKIAKILNCSIDDLLMPNAS